MVVAADAESANTSTLKKQKHKKTFIATHTLQYICTLSTRSRPELNFNI